MVLRYMVYSHPRTGGYEEPESTNCRIKLEIASDS